MFSSMPRLSGNCQNITKKAEDFKNGYWLPNSKVNQKVKEIDKHIVIIKLYHDRQDIQPRTNIQIQIRRQIFQSGNAKTFEEKL